MTDYRTTRSTYGKRYYDTGELRYEGYYTSTDRGSFQYQEPDGRGVCYYKTGSTYRDGQFQHGGLLEGKEYYPSGAIKFAGRYDCREIDGQYYGPSYPVSGKFYGEDGSRIHEGDFQIFVIVMLHPLSLLGYVLNERKGGLELPVVSKAA